MAGIWMAKKPKPFASYFDKLSMTIVFGLLEVLTIFAILKLYYATFGTRNH
ncbi:hypothetical protein [Flavobacterium sp.]|jgi:hypothetical protein|uniref:hypothetical protein n=1 Tax=Flavobacterium sp. TaxID=239 RepID=UPI003750418D